MPGKCAGYRPGIPQQPYTKWDTDKDEVEVDYKHLDDKQRSWFSGRKGYVLRVLIILVVFSLGLIIGYVVRRSVHSILLMPHNCNGYTNGYEGYSNDLSDELHKFIDPDSISQNLKRYTSTCHQTAVHDNNVLGNTLLDQMRSYNLKTKTASYDVLLSYADGMEPNKVMLVNETGGDIMYTVTYKGPSPSNSPSNDPEITNPYNAYAPNGTVEGELVYANYGSKEDFQWLASKNISCKGAIVIMRYGKLYRGTKVQNAYDAGAIGVLLYSDPAEVLPMQSHDHYFPATWWLPPWGIQWGSVLSPNLAGDPLTPGLPSIEGIYRIPLSTADLPKIPVQPISYGDAHDLMLHMKGPVGPTLFIGGLHSNVTYHVGPGFSGPREGWKVKLEINNDLERRTIRNLFGVIEGFEEPDRYVIVGCHYDAWMYGAVDPNSGTAVLMEVAKAFGNLTHKGWRPRRTIIFAHWDGEEQGIHGSYEWVQEHSGELFEKAVAYINLDAAVMGNYTLKTEATPPLHNLVLDTAKRLAPLGPDPDDTITSLYQQWTHTDPDEDNDSKPKIHNLGYGSDHAAFVYTVGVPSLYPHYMHTKDVAMYPGYHTAIDNYTLVETFLDPDFKAHKSLADLVSEVTLRLASHTRLPLDIREYGTLLEGEFDSLRAWLTGKEEQAIDKLNYLQWAIGNFTEAAKTFMEDYKNVKIDNVLELRRANDKVMQVSRAFISPQGLPGRPQFKNILFAPSAVDSYTPSTFTGIRDAYTKYSQAKAAKPGSPIADKLKCGKDSDSRSNVAKCEEEVEIQISVATLAVHSAENIITDSIIK